MRGRKPVPSQLKELRGNPGKRAISKPFVEPQQGAPACPDWLDEEGRIEWGRVCMQLEACKMLYHVDRALLAAYCEAWSEFKDAVESVREEGLTTPTALGGSVQNPNIRTKNQAAARLIRLASEFGFSPAARARVKLAGEREPGDEFEEFAKRA